MDELATSTDGTLSRLRDVRRALSTMSLSEVQDAARYADAALGAMKALGATVEDMQECGREALHIKSHLGELLPAVPHGPGRGKKDCTSANLSVPAHSRSRYRKIHAHGESIDAYVDHCKSLPLESDAIPSAKGFLRWVKQDAATNSSEPYEGGCEVEDLEVAADDGKRWVTFYADPPWQYDNQGTRAATNNHYVTMPTSEVAALPVERMAADKSLLFLWTTNGFLEAALTRVIPAWGFEFKSSMVWVKPQMGIGNYVRNAHEFLLIANRGGLTADGKSQISWVQAGRTEHSAKPNAFREIVESIAPAPRIELFAREMRPGWDAWGNQVSRQRFLGK